LLSCVYAALRGGIAFGNFGGSFARVSRSGAAGSLSVAELGFWLWLWCEPQLRCAAASLEACAAVLKQQSCSQ